MTDQRDLEDQASRPEPTGSEEAALPGSSDAVEEAYDRVAGEPGGTDTDAHHLLRDQSRLVREQIGALRRARWRDFFVTAIAFLILSGIVAMIVRASSANSVVFEPFDAPPALAARGISAEVIASSIQDAASVIQASNYSAANARAIDSAWADDVKVEVPSTGISFGELDRMLRGWLGHETHIGGALIINADKTLTLSVRATGVPARAFTGTDAELPALQKQAAEYVYGRFEPVLYAQYLRRSGRTSEMLAFVEQAYARGPETVRSSLAAAWAAALGSTGHPEEASAKGRLAIELDPYNWIARSNLIGVLYDTEGEEGAARAGKKMDELLASAPKDRQPAKGSNPRVNYLPLFQDWTSLIEKEVAALALTGGRGAYISNDSNLAIGEAEGHRHDWRAARRYVAASPASPTRAIADRLVAAYYFTETNRAAFAIAPMEQAFRLWQSDDDARFTFPSAPCWLARAYGLNGRIAEAQAVMQKVGRWAEGEVFRGDIVARTGNHVAADRLYARAARLYLSLPLPFYRWGMALAERGDLAGARQRLEQAAAKGPHWADPLKALGDLAGRRGAWKEASAYYDRARAFAPRWTELARAAAEARTRAAASSRWF